jgi:hypothetical protein
MTILRKVGQWIGLNKKEWEGISGHSARVGAAQDLLALNIDMALVMLAGRWKDTRVPKPLRGKGFGLARSHGEGGEESG